MSKNLTSASIVFVTIALWLGSGQLSGNPGVPGQHEIIIESGEHGGSAGKSADRLGSQVRVAIIPAERRVRHVQLRGRTESKRMVDVKSELAGRVVAMPANRGEHVKQGDLLCELDIDDRGVALQEALAMYETASIEYQGSLRLKQKNLLSDVDIAKAEARREAAKAKLHRQRLNLARTKILAPFDGVVDKLHVNVGDHADPGTTCVTLIDLNPMLVVAHVSESEVDSLRGGEPARGWTASGRELQGVLSFVASHSAPKTRTYPVEISIDNTDHSIRSGLTVTMDIAVEEVTAHLVAPSLLSLNDAGVIGLKVLDSANTVVFQPVVILDDNEEGTWVTGLADWAHIITVGQQYVALGDIVEPRYIAETATADQIATL